MNIALITAAGVGNRMHQEIPKQFINIYDKPLIIYTLEAFQAHPNIDGIEVVCLDGWHEILWAYCRQFGITKLENIVSGGVNGQDSIRNGLLDLKKRYENDDVVIIHDGNRPMVSAEIISDSIQVCNTYGNAISVIPCTEALLKINDAVSAVEQIQRDDVKRTHTPHSFHLGDIVAAHKEALEKGITNTVASCTMYTKLGKKVYFSAGSEKNIKITTLDDLDIFKALLKSKRAEWLQG